jgi:hypothetical protein
METKKEQKVAQLNECEKCKKKYKLVADAILCCSGW